MATDSEFIGIQQCNAFMHLLTLIYINILISYIQSSHIIKSTLSSLPDHGENRTRDLWDTSPMLCQLSYEVMWVYEVKSVRVCGIPELRLVDIFCVCFDVT